VSGPSEDGPPVPAVDEQAVDELAVYEQYARPDGIFGSFAPAPAEPVYTAPPPMVSPQERETYSRSPGSAEFAPPPGERLPPRHGVIAPAVPPGSGETFGRTRSGADGFDPAPGTRMPPTGKRAESPWWKADAIRDPWRDPGSPSWLGRPAVLAAGQLAQLDPFEDVEFSEDDFTPAVEDETPDEPKDRRIRVGRFGLSGLMLALVVALVAGSLGGGIGYWLSERAHGVLHNKDVSLAKTDTPANRPKGSVAEIVQRVGPAVVSIDVHSSDVQGTGSGVVIDKGGYILTNNHVVSAAASSGTIDVTFTDQDTVAAKIVGRDPLTDLAVIKVDYDKLTVATLGDSSQLAQGDPVIAIGSPLGLRNSVSAGIVSALDRPVPVSGDESDTNAVLDAIQTDAAINPGNSGGALVDAAGAVVGINSAIASLPSSGGGQAGSVGIGFAIPINEARDVATQLIRTGKAVHATIGINGSAVSDGSRQGAYVAQVIPGGGADRAGIKAGDVITLADSTLITSAAQLTVVVQKHKPGDVIKVRYYRGSAETDVDVTLGTG
jgi:S1-C subfamily serine protease